MSSQVLNSQLAVEERFSETQDSAAYDLLSSLLGNSLISAKRWNTLDREVQQQLRRERDAATLVDRLEEANVITPYQANRIRVGRQFGLLLGNYRILDRIGVGGMGVVYKAEHLRLPRFAAIKVLSCNPIHNDEMLDRFFFEMEAVARLNHPNIVSAIDAGVAKSARQDIHPLYYFVMDFVPGRTLEEAVATDGPMDLLTASDLIYQVAAALGEAHAHNLIHRDLKPGNVIVTPEGLAKLLDFGLARGFDSSLTAPGTVLGTLDYLPPEQAEDSASVDTRADVFGLGGTFFWCLTGEPPFPSRDNVTLALAARLCEKAPDVQDLRPEIPRGLADIVAKMLAPNPAERFQSVEEIRRALIPYLKPETYRLAHLAEEKIAPGGATLSDEVSDRVKRVLVVEDDVSIRRTCQAVLSVQGIQTEEADCLAQARDKLSHHPFDLVLLDVHLGGEESGLTLLDEINLAPPSPRLKVILFSGEVPDDELAERLCSGAAGYLTKPFSLVQLVSRVKSALHLKDAEELSDRLNQHLLSVNSQLEQNLNSRDSDLIQARNALVLALAELVNYRDSQSGNRLCRMQHYCRTLAEAAADVPGLNQRIDAHFIQMLECVAPLHDIGKVGLPDHVLLKPGKLEPEERVLMQTHTFIGAETLEKVAEQHGFSVTFFQMAIDVARHHHERWDGKGYPDGLAGEEIPLAARIVSVADTYDALRSRRTYKPALSHPTVIQMMTKSSEGQFDPNLLQALTKCAGGMERIYRELQD